MPNFIRGNQLNSPQSIRYEICSAGDGGIYWDTCAVYLETAKEKGFREVAFPCFTPRFIKEGGYDIKGSGFALSHSCR